MRQISEKVARLRAKARVNSAPEPHPDLLRVTPEDRRYLTSFYDDAVPLPEGAEETLVASNPRLTDLRNVYGRLDLPALNQSRWHAAAIEGFLDLPYFRGETLITWHYRELPRITALKYFLYLRYVQAQDRLGLLERLDEDGLFGCWTYEYPGYSRVSRDLLDSVNEISWLERRLSLAARDRFSVLDIGAGYGRLAHRMTEAFEQLDDYCCVDAIAECTFLSEYYLRFRGCSPRARVVPLTDVETGLSPGQFDLAINVHSFSECTYAAVEWWLDQVARLRIPWLLVIPNEPLELLTLEADGSHRDFAPLLTAAGYRLACREPVVQDPAVSELLMLSDQFHLYALGGADG